jgi:6-phosphogluconolactonase
MNIRSYRSRFFQLRQLRVAVFSLAACIASVYLLGCAGTSRTGSADVKTSAAANVTELIVHVGTYTRQDSKGIYTFRMDLATGKLTPIGVTESVNPSFLAIHPTGRSLYAVSEIGDFQGKKTGAVRAFQRDPKSGKLTPLNNQPSGGQGPCHLVVDQTGKNVLVANYGSGSVSVLPIAGNGSLSKPSVTKQHAGSSVNTKRQQGPHAHSINLDYNNRFAVAADLGIDKVMIYKFDSGKGTLVNNNQPFIKTPAGGGPRHLAFHPSNKFAYVCNELTSAVTAMSFNEKTGALTSLHTLSTLPVPKPDLKQNNSTAETQVHPSGRYVYVSNRGHNSIAIFKVDQNTGRLTAAGHASTKGEIPRNFCVDPTGQYILAANQKSHNVAVLKINLETGMLVDTGIEVKVPTPVCIKFFAASN